MPISAATFVNTKQKQLHTLACEVDDDYEKNEHLTINDDGKPILKLLNAKPIPENIETIKQQIMDEMPIVSMVDVIIDVEKWLSLSVHLKPLSGYESKIYQYPSRFVATTFSYGTNMGPTQGERSLLRFTRKQIAWVFNHHMTDQRILKLITKLLDQYALFALPKQWGSGNSVSVDGTFCDMYTQNLLAAHHIRYRRYGGVAYYHVSDQYIALFSNFISCGAHESVYLLDGIVENDSEIKPTVVHGDSWAQSEVLFGVSSLFAIAIMPRIKHFKHLNFYKASKDHHYVNIDDLFTDKPADWKLIEDHYRLMLRVVISIHKGKVKSSTVLRKLCSKSRKNKLYFAFRELGRVERTIFLLKYISDPQLRKTIQAATCKSEEFNEFMHWLRFGGGGVIHDNLRFNQLKIIRMGHLLANMVMFYNVVHQTKCINKLREQGIDIPDEKCSLAYRLTGQSI